MGRDLDELLATMLALLAITLALRQFHYYGDPFHSGMTVAMAALPITCLLVRPSIVSMAGVVVTGFPCFCSGAVICDTSPSAATGGLLHEVEAYLLIVPIYGFIRLLHLAISGPQNGINGKGP